MRKYLLSTVLCLMVLPMMAIGPYTDPGRAIAIYKCSEAAKKALKAQTVVQGENATGHIFLQDEVEKTTKWQKEYNDYLEAFGEVLSLTAEAYGIYYEVDKTIKNINDLGQTLSHSPTNTLAVAFSTRRNKVYRQVAEQGLGIVNDIKQLFTTKMTQQDRYKLISKIRPKLRAMNKSLVVMNLAIKYTSFTDVWREITDRQAEWCTHRTKKEIARKCIRDWKTNVGMR